MKISKRYTWSAQTADGEIITSGGDLTGCVKFSLVPAPGVTLPCHDVCGVRLVRRFGRGFKRMPLCDADELCVAEFRHGSAHVKTVQDLRARVTPGQLIRAKRPGDPWYLVAHVDKHGVNLASPYSGKDRDLPALLKDTRLTEEFLQCVVCEGFRLYVRCSDGATAVTPEDYELYL